MDRYGASHQGLPSASPIRVSVSVDDQGAAVITDCSTAVSDRLGYDSTDLVGEPLDRLYVRPPESDDSRALLRAANGDTVPAIGTTEATGNDEVRVVFVPEDSSLGQHATGAEAAVLEPGFEWYRNRIYDAFAEPDTDTEAAIQQALDLGAEYLGMALGCTCEIAGGTQTITRVSTDHATVQPGITCPLEEAYCRRTVERDRMLCAQSATDTGEITDEAIDRFDLGSYIGKRVRIDEGEYATVCFSDSKPRSRPFTSDEKVFVESIANLVGKAIERQRYERTLKQREEWLEADRDGLQAFYEHGPLMFVQTRIVDGVAVVDSCNDQFAKRLGYTKEEVVGEPLQSFYADSSSPTSRRFEGGDDLDQRFRNAERTLETSQGDLVHTILQAGPYGARENGPGWTNVVFLDVTKRRAYENELESFRQAIEDATDGIALLDADGQYRYVNDAHAKIYGYDDPDVLIGEGWQRCYNDAEQDRFESDILPQVADRGEWRGEATGRRQDGTTFPQEVSLTDLEDGLICVVQDISGRTARKQELELKERAMDEANVAIQITDATDPENPIEYVNKQFERQTGYSTEEAIGRNPRFLQGPDTDLETVAKIRESLDSEQSMSTTVLNYRADGTPYWNRLSVTPVYDANGSVTNYIGISEDVTESRRRRERLEDQQRKLDTVLSATGTGIVEMELQSGEISWDKTLEKRFGDAPPTLPAFFDRVHEADRARLQQLVTDLIETQEVATARYRLLDDEGTPRWVKARATPIVEDGELARLLATFTDITQEKETEARALEASERVELFTENAKEYAFIPIDETGTIDSWNTGAERLFRCDAATAKGMTIGELLRVEDRDGDLSERLRQQARIAGNSSYTGWLTRTDGSEFYAEVRYVPTTTTKDGLTRFTVIVHDQTSQYRQRQRTERFVEESVDVVAIMDPDGTFEYLSGSVEQELGYEAAELCGRNAFDLVHPMDLVGTMEEFFAATQDPDYPAQAEFRLQDADGEWRTLDARVRNLIDDEAIGGLLVYARDVSERNSREQRFEAIFNQTYQLTGVLDTDGRVLELNETALELAGLDREAVVGSRLWATPLWSHSKEGRNRIKRAVEQATKGEFARYEAKVLGRDGVILLDFSVKPVTDDEDDVAFIVFEGRDITSQRRQRQHSTVLQRVLRHNIRNDLTKLYAYVELLAEEDDPRTRSEYAETVESTLETWESITENVARIERTIRRQQQHQTVVDAEELVSRVRSTAADLHSEAEITIVDTAAVEAEIPEAIDIALLELIDNAVDATSATSPTVKISVTKPSERWASITVADNGTGMPEDEAKVLEDGEETPLRHGQGLGLWLVRSIVVQAGGWVDVDVTDEGTEVTLHVRDDPELALQATVGEDDD